MRRALIVLAVTALASAALPATASARHCGRIAFEPQTDNGAANIHADGTSCRRARRIVRQVYNGNRAPFGYSCRSRAHDTDGLFHRHWTCTKNNARVTWIKF